MPEYVHILVERALCPSFTRVGCGRQKLHVHARIGESIVSVSDVMSRISSIQTRFGLSPMSFYAAPSVADYAPLADEALLIESGLLDDINQAASNAGVDPAELLELLAVQRADARISQPATPVADRVFPVPGESAGSPFGIRSDPFTGEPRMHKGVDVGAPMGTPIVAAQAGTVTFAGEWGSYGNIVIIDHGDGVETRYAHQSQVGVAAGDRVEAGQAIGAVGSTGRSTGPHLHFEVRVDGEAIDPVEWLGS